MVVVGFEQLSDRDDKYLSYISNLISSSAILKSNFNFTTTHNNAII